MIKSISQAMTNRAPPGPPRTLQFSPYAWAKLLHLRDRGRIEVGGFGVSEANNLLRVEDVCLVRQLCTPVTVRFDDQSVADYFDSQVDAGLAPEQFARIWAHTHPGNSAQPTAVDEETFQRCFGSAGWAVMFILAKGGETYARLQFNAGPGLTVELAVQIDFSQAFPAANHDAWSEDYDRFVVTLPDSLVEQPAKQRVSELASELADDRDLPWWWDDPWPDALEHTNGDQMESAYA